MTTSPASSDLWWQTTAAVVRRIPGLLLGTDRGHVATWIRSQRAGWPIRSRRPWITFSAAEFLDDWTASAPDQFSVFEYGSGGSTLYWLDRGARVVSIEHDAHWYAQMQRLLPAHSGVDYRLVPPQSEERAHFDRSDPRLGHSDDPAYAQSTFIGYASQIDAYPDLSFDIVLVDGRARPTCLAHAIPKARHLIVLDNADRSYYLARTQRLLAGFEHQMFIGLCPGVPEPTRTDVFRRLTHPPVPNPMP
jgi:hypothetical protein